jgi:hypothetical protein
VIEGLPDPRISADEEPHTVVCVCLDQARTPAAVREAVARAVAEDLPVLAYVALDESRAWRNGEVLLALAGFPPLDAHQAAVEEVRGLAGEWSSRVTCVTVSDPDRIAQLAEAVRAEGLGKAIYVGCEPAGASA